MLVVRAVAGGEADLRQRIIEARLFGDLGELEVVFGGPVGALLYRGNDEAPETLGTQ